MKDYEDKLELFPISDAVTYKYYCGKQRMLEENYGQAKKDLEFAFKHCHKDHASNQLRIMVLLLPLKLLVNGQYPTDALFQKYPIPSLQTLIRAVQAGNMRSFQEVMERYEQEFIDMGIFLVLDKMDALVWRNFMKRVLNVQRASGMKRPSVVHMKTITAALKL